MKTELFFAAIAVTVLALCGPSQAQQMGYGPYMGYAQPIGYAQPMGYAQPVPYLPQTAHMPAAPAIQPTAAMQPVEDLGEEECCGCGESCDSCGCGSGCCCCDPCCGPRWRAWADFLYICARDAEVAYAVPKDGPIVQPEDPVVQVGPTAVADFDYEPNFRVGFGGGLGDCSRVAVSYTSFEAATTSSISVLPDIVIHSLVSHPRTDTASQQFLDAAAAYSMDYDLIDIDLSRTISCGCRHMISVLLGARYAGLQQDFQSIYTTGTNEEIVTTDIHFDGGGIRVGLDAEFYNCRRTLLTYCRSAASFVAGEFDAVYTQDDLLGGQPVYTDWQAGRIVSMLDLEIGFGWASPQGNARVTAGYMVSGWFNTVVTDEWVKAVQYDDLTNLNNALAFDGFVLRSEFRF
jgi:hypothetical protein